MNLAVIGVRRVGLVAVAGLADFGLRVLCVDIDESKIAALTRGNVPFHEPGLVKLLEKNCDVHTIAKALGSDKRIGPKFLHAGPGFGGACLPKDTCVLMATAEQYGVKLRTVAAALETNYTQCREVLGKLKNVIGPLEGRTICVLGLACKPPTDDVRESRAMDLVRLLLEEGAAVQAHDPAPNTAAAAFIKHERLSFFDDPYEAASGADALAVLTEWNEFRSLVPGALKRAMRGAVLLDVHNVFVPEVMAAAGFVYLGRGRRPKTSAAVLETSETGTNR
jgi:UDPglucose 6-dehydrogenase